MSTDNSSRDSARSIMKSTSILSLGTLSSRILGFIRDIILAKVLGTAYQADAFFVAFRIPNLFRELVGEGATNSAIVPVLSEYEAKKDKNEFFRLISVIFTLAGMILGFLTIMGVLFSPILVRAMAFGFRDDPAKLFLTIQLTKLMFPYLIFIGLTAYCIGILFVFRSFVAPAFSPCILNICLIFSALLGARYLEEPVYGLAFGVLFGGLMQFFFQFLMLRKLGLKRVKSKKLFHPGAVKIGKLLVPRLFGAGVYQLNVFIDTFCSSLSGIIGLGGVSAIYYSNRIIQFPLGVFCIALASAMLPTLSKHAALKDFDQVRININFMLKNILFMMVPVGVLLVILAVPIIRILFERGEFNAYSTNITGLALMFYAFGLCGYAGIKIMVTAYHAMQDTRTPVTVAAGCLLLNLILNFILMWPLQVGGIALASSISASVNFLLLYYLMNKRLGGMNAGIKEFVCKIVAATIVMGMAVGWGWKVIGFDNEIIKLGMMGMMGVCVYCGMTYILRVEQAEKIFNWIKR